MQHPMPKERAEKGLGKRSMNNVGIKVGRPCKPEKKDKSRLERIDSGVQKNSKTKLDSKVDKLPFKPEIKVKMILDGNTKEPVLKRKDHTVVFTDHARSEFTRAVQDGNTSFQDVHISFLERVVGSDAVERLFLSLPECFSANITEEEADKFAGMKEVRKVFPPFRFSRSSIVADY